MQPARSPQADSTEGRCVVLRCPECAEPAYRVPPVDWIAGWGPRPNAAHGDGTPLCPVMGPHGYRPADPQPVAAQPADPTDLRAPSRPDASNRLDGRQRND